MLKPAENFETEVLLRFEDDDEEFLTDHYPVSGKLEFVTHNIFDIDNDDAAPKKSKSQMAFPSPKT